ncbi:MAG: hypothetical protein LIR50_04305, partial [Bacillota bacterium]|nr:hypothetical protein [Bacillota bacterium]
ESESDELQVIWDKLHESYAVPNRIQNQTSPEKIFYFFYILGLETKYITLYNIGVLENITYRRKRNYVRDY